MIHPKGRLICIMSALGLVSTTMATTNRLTLVLATVVVALGCMVALHIKEDRSVDEERQMTFGEKAVGLTFNPSGDPNVERIKKLYAEIIDFCNDQRKSIPGDRLFSIAITEAQGAQMWAVKAITWRDG